MATQVKTYQCPNCLAGLRFDEKSGQLACDSCGTTFAVSVIEQLFADKEQIETSARIEPEWKITLDNNFSEEEAKHLRSYSCPSCAAEIICDDTTAATSCPYCGNSTIIPGQLRGELKPDYVIPFKFDKKAAVQALKEFCKGKRLLPKNFSDENHLEEVKGIYVPFWLYNGEAEAAMRFRATKMSTHILGDYMITNIDHYRVTREGSISFEKVPVDGSSKIADEHMDSIEPFNYSDLVSFSSAYLPGFLAERYDEDAETCSKRANERIFSSTEKAFLGTISGYSTLTREYSNVDLKKGDVKYALMPVWLLSTRWKDKNFLFAMNGQTGKIIGDLPVDAGRYWSWIFMIAVPIAALLAVILFLGVN